MNQIDYSKPGGFPLTQNELAYQQAALLDSLKGIVSAFNLSGTMNVIILSGCEVSTAGLNTIITPGYISWDGEIMQVAGATIATVAAPLLLELSDTPHPTLDPTTFFTGGSHNVHRLRTVYPTFTSSGTTRPLLDENRIRNIFVGYNQIDPWHVIGNAGEPVFGTGWAHGANALKFKKDRNGLIHISGSCGIISASFSFVITTLPLGYRPQSDVMTAGVYIHNTATGDLSPIILKVMTNGDLTYFADNVTINVSNNEIYFAVQGFIPA